MTHLHTTTCRHRLYYLTCEAFDKLLHLSGGRCQLCGKGSRSTLVIDHDHDCHSKVRGLLCNGCNVRLARVDSGRRTPTQVEQAYLDTPFYSLLSEPDYIGPRRKSAGYSGLAVRMAPAQVAVIDRLAAADDRSRNSMAILLLREALNARAEAGRLGRAEQKDTDHA